jgi:hypothetical protein
MTRKTFLLCSLGCLALAASWLLWLGNEPQGSAPILTGQETSHLEAAALAENSSARTAAKSDAPSGSQTAAQVEPAIRLTPAAQRLLDQAAPDAEEFQAITQMADMPDERAPADREFLRNVERFQIEDQLELSELGQQLHGAERTVQMIQQLNTSTPK